MTNENTETRYMTEEEAVDLIANERELAEYWELFLTPMTDEERLSAEASWDAELEQLPHELS